MSDVIRQTQVGADVVVGTKREGEDRESETKGKRKGKDICKKE